MLLGIPQHTSADTTQTSNTVPVVEATVSSYTVRGFAEEVAYQDDVSPSTMDYVLQNESGYDQDAIGDHGAARNCAQFHKPTFDWMKKESIVQGLPYQNLTYNSCKDQIILLGWALKNDLGWNWTTWKRYQSLLS